MKSSRAARARACLKPGIYEKRIEVFYAPAFEIHKSVTRQTFVM